MDARGIKFDEQGLVPAIAQDEGTGEVLMLAYMNSEALEKTLRTGRAHYFSRSRNRLWLKGETSGNFQFVKAVYYDCDNDALLLMVDQKGVACHTGERSCFFRRLDKGGAEKGASSLILSDLYRVLVQRKGASPEKSYVASLYSGGKGKILEKIREESDELIEAAGSKGRGDTVHELADLWFHTMVLLAHEDIDVDEVFGELKRRFGTSGMEEKRKRNEE